MKLKELLQIIKRANRNAIKRFKNDEVLHTPLSIDYSIKKIVKKKKV